ncbi:glutaredoxin family protein (plasmid) [Tomitella fengzijianii]|uniref:Glutaredoxin family protein n=1 Tax=Tomitella fengzijianii TaxID=2597660 RepID=A0A516X8V6_9ACTN|nr:glutaredoxin family protein [Tomitella fengzijianii]QDQ99497.1 glutaredoxin family protein [Tomitella fengzijianii]
MRQITYTRTDTLTVTVPDHTTGSDALFDDLAGYEDAGQATWHACVRDVISDDLVHVRVFTTAQCQACRMTKRMLDDRRIAYSEEDVTDNDEAREYVADTLGHRQLPVVVIERAGRDDDELIHWSGHRPDRIAQITR